MKIFIQIRFIAYLLFSATIVAGLYSCYSPSLDEVLETIPNVRSVYSDHLKSTPESHNSLRPANEGLTSSYETRVDKIISADFHRLNNPDLIMWIHAHIRKGVSVSAYPVSFSMYRNVYSSINNKFGN